MKKYILITLILATTLVSCEEDFLERIPTTEITADGFFNTEGDLEIYTNGFYDYFGAGVADLTTDDQTRYSEGDALATKLKGNLTVSNAGGWSGWGTLRDINFFLENYNNNNISETGNPAVVNHHIAFARFSRARWYMGKIRDYGMVPWFEKPLNVDDEELLYKGHDTREFVVGKIMEDLEFAIANLNASDGSKSRITQMTALAEMSRFALYEGTFRNYHTEVGLSDGNSFLTKSANASAKIMSNGGYSIHSTGNINQDYQDLFRSPDLGGNSEVILNIEYQKDAPSRTHWTVVDTYWGLSKNLIESYLMTDGSTFTSQPNSQTKEYTEVFENRDPRIYQTVAHPGFIYANTDYLWVGRMNYGGYTQIKWLQDDPDLSNWSSPMDAAAYRYAEVLLNYAEAKAELGTITQGDINQTINKIRDRVNMPGLNMTTANSNPDPVQAEQYPNVSGANAGVILEIRRERRIEFACEGFRTNDMYRWKEGNTLAEAQLGMYVAGFGPIDITGNGVPDVAILSSPSETGPIDGLPDDVKNALALYYVGSDGFYLTEGDSGFLAQNADVDQPKSFIEPKYYYSPIPLSHTIINPALTQPPGW